MLLKLKYNYVTNKTHSSCSVCRSKERTVFIKFCHSFLSLKNLRYTHHAHNTLPNVPPRVRRNASQPILTKLFTNCLFPPTEIPRKNSKAMITKVNKVPICFTRLEFRKKYPTTIPRIMKAKIDNMANFLQK